MKKLLLAIPTIALILSLSACNNSSKKNEASTEQEPQEQLAEPHHECDTADCTGPRPDGRCCKDPSKPACDGHGHSHEDGHSHEGCNHDKK